MPLIQPAPTSAAEANLLDEVVRRLVDELHPDRIYLFGSRARGDWGPDSDYDFMVLLPGDVKRPYVEMQRAQRALRGISIGADVLVTGTSRFDWLSEAAASLSATIKREGRQLYAA